MNKTTFDNRQDTLDIYSDKIIGILLNKQLDTRAFQKALNGIFDTKISLSAVRGALTAMRQHTELKHLIYMSKQY